MTEESYVPNPTRVNAAIIDTRRLIVDELKKELISPERALLLAKLADLQVETKRRNRRRYKKHYPPKKRGRKKKLFDSHGQPLYNNVKMPVVKDETALPTDSKDAKSAFLERLKKKDGPETLQETA